MRKLIAIAAFTVVLGALGGGVADAQGTLAIVGPSDGDCSVQIANVPATTDIHQLALFVDDHLLTVRPARRHATTVTLTLLDPLQEGSAVAVAVGRDGTRTAPVYVQ